MRTVLDPEERVELRDMDLPGPVLPSEKAL